MTTILEGRLIGVNHSVFERWFHFGIYTEIGLPYVNCGQTKSHQIL